MNFVQIDNFVVVRKHGFVLNGYLTIEFQDASFEKFLQSRGLPEKVIDYIAHSIAMVGRDAPTVQALEATKVFLTSLGRFGNAPFLYPIFGVGELGQAFCRYAVCVLASFPGQFFINRTDEKNRPGIDCIDFCAHAQNFRLISTKKLWSYFMTVNLNFDPLAYA